MKRESNELVRFIKVDYVKDYDTKSHFAAVIKAGKGWEQISNTTLCGACEVRIFESERIQAMNPMTYMEAACLAGEAPRDAFCGQCVGEAVAGDAYSNQRIGLVRLIKAQAAQAVQKLKGIKL